MDYEYKSTETKDLVAALCKAQAEFPSVPKNGYSKGKQYSFRWSTLDDIIKYTLPVLSKHGLTINQLLLPATMGFMMKTILTHISGQWIASEVRIDIKPEQSYQDIGKAITYFRRYCLSPLLGIASDEDTDGPDDEAQGAKYHTEYAQSIKPQDDYISSQQRETIAMQLVGYTDIARDLITLYNIQSLGQIKASQYDEVLRRINLMKKNSNG